MAKPKMYKNRQLRLGVSSFLFNMGPEKGPQKTIPLSVKESRLVTNPPDYPQAGSTEINNLSTIHPSTARISPDSTLQPSPTRIKTAFGIIEGRRLTPIATLPLTRAAYCDVRGGRIIGGGTSKEAIRKAKRKSRRIRKSP